MTNHASNLKRMAQRQIEHAEDRLLDRLHHRKMARLDKRIKASQKRAAQARAQLNDIKRQETVQGLADLNTPIFTAFPPFIVDREGNVTR